MYLLEALAFKLTVRFIIHHGHQVDENKIDLQVLILFYFCNMLIIRMQSLFSWANQTYKITCFVSIILKTSLLS